MIRPCHVCGTPIDDHKHVRYTIKGEAAWYCTAACADKA